MNQVQRIWVVAFLFVSSIAGNAFSNESGFLSWLSSSPMSAQAGTVEDASPIPVEESQIYWAGLLNYEAGAIVQIQNGDFNFIDFDPDSEPAENKALVFGTDLPAYPVDVSIVDSTNELQITIIEQPRPWNDYSCFMRLKPPADVAPDTQYEMLLGWGSEVDPGPAPTPGPLPTADTENINSSAYFPDLNFRLAILRTLETPFDTVVTPPDARAYQGEMNIADQDIGNVTGLAFFENITALDCSKIGISKLDVSGFPSLVTLVCTENNLREIDISKNPELRKLDFSANNIKAFDITTASQLEYLNCGANPLQTINLSNNPKLKELWCHNSRLTALDVSHNPELTDLYCFVNKIATLDLHNNTRLEMLYCDYNQLIQLDVSNQPVLKYLFCGNNLLTALDFSNNPELAYLICHENSLTSLDLSAQTAISLLWCANNSLTEMPDILNSQKLEAVDVRGNLLDEGDCPEITVIYNRVSKARYQDENQRFLIEGFAYSPQKEGLILDCGLVEPTPTPSPTPISGPGIEQLPVAAGPEDVGIVPLTGDVSLWAENGGGSKYWRPEADTLSNGNAIVLGGMRKEPGSDNTRDMVAIFSPTGELIEPSRTAFFTDAGEPWPETICTSRNDDKFYGLCADTVGERNGTRYVVHTIANPDAFPEAFPVYPAERSGEYHTAIQVVSNDGVPETPLINPWGEYLSESGLIRGGMIRFLSNGNIVMNFEDQTKAGSLKDAFYGREGNYRVVGAAIFGPDGNIVKPPFAISNPSTSLRSECRFGLTSGDGWFAIRYKDGIDGPTIVAFDNDGNELGAGEGRVYPAIDIPELQTDGGNRGDPNGLEAMGDTLYITHRGADRRGYLTKFRVDENGVSVLKTVQFTDHEQSTFEHNADLGVDSDGNVMVIWQDQSWERFQTGRWEMLARMFDSNLEPVTSSFCMFEVGSNLDQNEVDPILGPGRTKQGRIAMNDEIIIAIAETNEVPYGDASAATGGSGEQWYTYTFIARVLENPMRPGVTDWELY